MWSEVALILKCDYQTDTHGRTQTDAAQSDPSCSTKRMRHKK